MFGKKNSNEGTLPIEKFEDSKDSLGVSLGDSRPDDEIVNTSPEAVSAYQIETLQSLTPPIITKPSILSQGFEFEGIIRSAGPMIISGRVIGKLAGRDITVENEGFVDGEITADTLTVKGNVLGDIRCRELTVGPAAHVDANSYFDTIEVQRGGKISGILNKN
ncbi:polymer-forming cytoskeletal protein [Polynucleobacter paneuropaeus]|jgi:cytoskeletal protein CcmA (bactofilin family)|uniref:Polymer-forming cytoskeletal protein n=1 Tax=Polynucleobacter paneuropaeus TaxID=2527775 RepID=A0AAE3CGM9_9BURK|nr:polymer-forming cytoskeletal protein [Polynucleobacter paneuropaeus]MBT8590304.1 polymer-forming cytoskeletal protein [Polynucleobacter paneuropaeus]MBT8590325.1 polymer-forming cytoskeletal protein [Polynucleobacter paneuropaeus]MBT8595701.1 polymer-forming cytoskeletal protein [Polynucleobacter paneuropaeus]MBT8597528.1 polymer-forming cytoskeletal protein [Polynucleobacter paneuropaeus]